MASVDARLIAEKVEIAEKVLGHTFSDRSLIACAITHPSAVENAPQESFERLEFLGDSVLGLLIAEELYRRFPAMDEGGMTRIKISLVAGSVLREVAQATGLGGAILYGESEIKTGGRGTASALEDVFESVVAALYLDAGMDAAREWVARTLMPLISEDAALAPGNPKGQLQEIVQADGTTPVYRVTGHDGPPHDRVFVAVVEIGGIVAGQGSGRSKREAEAAAAQAALDAIEGHPSE